MRVINAEPTGPLVAGQREGTGGGLDAIVPAGDGQATCGTSEVPLKAAAFRP